MSSSDKDLYYYQGQGRSSYESVNGNDYDLELGDVVHEEKEAQSPHNTKNDQDDPHGH